MSEIPDLDYTTFPLEVKYGWMQKGPGAAGAAPSAQSLSALAPAFEESADTLQTALRGSGVSWQGRAANATSEALRQAAQWATGTGRTSKTGGTQLDTYSNSFAHTKNSIPRPIDIGENSFLGGVADSGFGRYFGMQSDFTQRLAAHREADLAASEAMKAYENTSRTTVTAFLTDQPAPALTAG